MNAEKLVSIQSAIWGFTGAAFFSFTTLFMLREDTILVNFVSGSHRLSESIHVQHIDAMIGFSFVALAFLGQFWAANL